MTSERDHSNVTAENKADGSFNRQVSSFRDVIEKGGRFEPEKGRYHLYVSYGCPWAHRTLIVRKLKRLEDIIGLTVVTPVLTGKGWPFANTFPFPGAEIDKLNGAAYLRDIYLKVEPNYTGRFTIPVLWDIKAEKIVNNESSEIIRILNTAFNEFLPAEKAALDLYPESLREDIDALNSWVYDDLNNGVYKSGFATTQEAYEKAVRKVFEALDRVEVILENKDYLVGGQLTEADVRLYTTAIRFDVAYHGIFKCNLRTIRSGYPNIHRWLRKLYWNNSAFKGTTDFNHIVKGYYALKNLNPSGIYPLGPSPLIEALDRTKSQLERKE